VVPWLRVVSKTPMLPRTLEMMVNATEEAVVAEAVVEAVEVTDPRPKADAEKVAVDVAAITEVVAVVTEDPDAMPTKVLRETDPKESVRMAAVEDAMPLDVEREPRDTAMAKRESESTRAETELTVLVVKTARSAIPRAEREIDALDVIRRPRLLLLKPKPPLPKPRPLLRKLRLKSPLKLKRRLRIPRPFPESLTTNTSSPDRLLPSSSLLRESSRSLLRHRASICPREFCRLMPSSPRTTDMLLPLTRAWS